MAANSVRGMLSASRHARSRSPNDAINILEFLSLGDLSLALFSDKRPDFRTGRAHYNC
jgi:hypothetical protein